MALFLEVKVNQSVPADTYGQEKRLEKHAQLAIDIAADCAVLLENDGILPLAGDKKILVVGDLFEKMRYQGAGSSGLNPAYLTTVKDAFDRAGVAYDFARGYRESTDAVDETLENEALDDVKDSDVVLFFGGLTQCFESEGFDRENLSLPGNQLRLIDKLRTCGRKLVIVLYGGSPYELPFAGQVNAILNMFLPGQGGGEATRRILFGEVCPGGKLSETWMKRAEDIPFGDRYGRQKIVPYKESIYVGYRYYDKAADKIRYPFGYGLSYTSFSYSELHVEHSDGKITVTFTVKNTGNADGAEIAQLYIGKNGNTAVFKAEKELKAFEKIYLKAGESKAVTLTLEEQDLAYYNTAVNAWIVENGNYPVLIGASSRDIRLTESITLTGYAEAPAPYSEAVVTAYDAVAQECVTDSIFESLIGRKLPDEPEAFPYTMETPLSDFRHNIMGRFLYKSIMKGVAAQGKGINRLPEGPEKDERIRNQNFVLRFIPCNSPRAMIQSGGGMMQMNMARAITEFANGHIFKALKALFGGEKPPKLPCERQEG